MPPKSRASPPKIIGRTLLAQVLQFFIHRTAHRSHPRAVRGIRQLKPALTPQTLMSDKKLLAPFKIRQAGRNLQKIAELVSKHQQYAKLSRDQFPPRRLVCFLVVFRAEESVRC